jgi:colicin import membrane protein
LKKESAKTKKEAAEKVTPSKTKAAKELTDKSTSAKATKTAAAKEVKKTNSTTESKSSSTSKAPSKAKAKKETASQEKAPRVPDKVTGEYNGKKVYTGPRGGTYYINSNGNKTYIQQ